MPPRALLPVYRRAPSGSKLDPFKDEIHRLLAKDAKLPGQRVPSVIAPLGFCGGKTIVDDYLREIRPLFDPPRSYQRTIYRPGEICQFDVWEPRVEIPVGHGPAEGTSTGRQGLARFSQGSTSGCANARCPVRPAR